MHKVAALLRALFIFLFFLYHSYCFLIKQKQSMCSHRGHLERVVGATVVQIMAHTGHKER